MNSFFDNIIENSFIRAIFKSLWVFSIILAASAVLIFLVLNTLRPTFLYKFCTNIVDFFEAPETNLRIFFKVRVPLQLYIDVNFILLKQNFRPKFLFEI